MIINGTFDTDLNGWEVSDPTGGMVIVESGRAKVWIQGQSVACSNVHTLKQTYKIEGKSLDFDYQTMTQDWGDGVSGEFYVDGTKVKDVGIPAGRKSTIQGHISVDTSQYIGRMGTILFASFPSAYCRSSDHGYTILYIDNVKDCAWRCEEGLTGYEVDDCGNRRPNPLCAYREASLVSCSWPQNPIAGQTYQVGITVNQGSKDENYKLVFIGDFTGESAPFMVNAGTGQQQFTAGNITFPTGGSKSVTAALVRV